MQTFYVGIPKDFFGESTLIFDGVLKVEAENFQVYSDGTVMFVDAQKKPIGAVAKFNYIIPKDQLHLFSAALDIEDTPMSYIKKNTEKVKS